jgi:phosphate/sulfate permease
MVKITNKIKILLLSFGAVLIVAGFVGLILHLVELPISISLIVVGIAVIAGTAAGARKK